jgi:hypothetical protein
MRSLGFVAFAAMLAGCSLLPPLAGIQITIPAHQDVPALPVTVVDDAGVVVEAATADIPEGFLGETSVEPVAGRDDAVVLAWMGGECDDRAIIKIQPAGNRYRATAESPSSAMGCSAVGVFRAVLLSLNKPVAAEAFDAS